MQMDIAWMRSDNMLGFGNMRQTHSCCEECKFVVKQKQKVLDKAENNYFCSKHGFNVNKSEWCPEGRKR